MIFNTVDKKEIREIAEYYGVSHQKRKAMEEMAELIQALNKDFDHGSDNPTADTKTRDAVVEEIADVLLMVSQLVYFYDCEAVVEEIMAYKVKRQLARMEGKELEL